MTNRVVSCTSDETQIIRDIIRLHNHGNAFDCDPTFSTGRFWRGLVEPRLKLDIAPQRADVIAADARALPLAARSVNSIMFDPPFVVAPNRKPGIIRDRFASLPNIPALWSFYADALAEFTRVLIPGGIVAFKCQDTITGARQYLSHVAVIHSAERAGFYAKDLFVLTRRNVLWSPNVRADNQQHARKNHSYFLVFKLEKRNGQCNRH